MTWPRSTDVVLIAFAHQWDVTLADDYEMEDLLDVAIVHKPARIVSEDRSGKKVKTVDIWSPACGQKIPQHYGVQTLPRRLVNMRNVRQCQRPSCFGAALAKEARR